MQEKSVRRISVQPDFYFLSSNTTTRRNKLFYKNKMHFNKYAKQIQHQYLHTVKFFRYKTPTLHVSSAVPQPYLSRIQAVVEKFTKPI